MIYCHLVSADSPKWCEGWCVRARACMLMVMSVDYFYISILFIHLRLHIMTNYKIHKGVQKIIVITSSIINL